MYKDLTSEKRSGYVALIGRPNVGKSTLLNKLLGQKVTITSRKAQTTRYAILGIKNQGNCQAIFVDTPGIDLRNNQHRLRKELNFTAERTARDVDLLLFVTEGTNWTKTEEELLIKLAKLEMPKLLIVNKSDLVSSRAELSKHLEILEQKCHFECSLIVSARHNLHLEEVLAEIYCRLPPSPWFFPIEMLTDRDLCFQVGEIVREKLMRYLGDELPYTVAVMTDEIKESTKLFSIIATIYVEKSGEKGIVIGEGGKTLKKIGSAARLDLEKLLGRRKIFLRLWVKVKRNWTRRAEELTYFGIKVPEKN